jgi:hypothetical protein
MQFFLWLQHSDFITWFSNSAVMVTFIEVIHYFSFFLLVGSIVLVDLRIIGVAARKRNAAELGANLFPVMWTGLALNFISGFILFLGDVAAFYDNWVFQIKLVVVLVAVVLGIAVQGTARWWGRPADIPIWAKLLAFASLAFWIGSIFVSLEVPALTSAG